MSIPIILVLLGLSVLVGVLGVVYAYTARRNYSKLEESYAEVLAQREAYIENVVERICVNESALAKHKTRINVSLTELESLAAGGASWEVIANKQRNILPLNRDNSGSDKLVELTQELRSQIYNYIPDDRSHLGGTVQRLDDFIDFIKLSVTKFKLRKSIEINLKISVEKGVNTRVFLFHDQDFIVRWFIFLSMYVKEENYLQTPPTLEITLSPGASKQSVHVATAFILYKADIIPKDFNLQYNFFFNTGLLPDEWLNLNPYLLEALKMSSFFSFLVKTRQDNHFRNTTLYFERDCYVARQRKDFDPVIALRQKYPAARLMYVCSHPDDYESKHINELFESIGLDLQTIPGADFSPSLLSRTQLVFINSALDYELREKIVHSILACPFAKVRICIVRKRYEAIFDEHDQIDYIDMPLSQEKINSVL